MPTGTIVADDYIDNPNRTVTEVQVALNGLLDYVRSLKAEIDAGLYLTTDDFDPSSATLVWSGNSTSVAISSLSEQGPGLYLINGGDSVLFSIHILDDSGSTRQSGSAHLNSSFYWTVELTSGATPSFEVTRITADTGFEFSIPILSIYKV